MSSTSIYAPCIIITLCLDLEKAMAPHSSTLAWRSHGQRSLVGCSPWGLEELDTTERLHFHFSLLCTGKGTGNPLQCSCLENPRDEEPGVLPSMGSHRVGHVWSDLAAAAAGLLSAKFLCPWDSSGKNTGVGCHALLQGIFLTQGSKQYLLHILHWQADSGFVFVFL